MRILFFVISDAKRNIHNELFDSVEVQCNSAKGTAFSYKLKRNLSSATEISQHDANTAFFAIFGRKE